MIDIDELRSNLAVSLKYLLAVYDGFEAEREATVVELEAIRRERDRYREALVRIAAYNDGAEIHGGMDSPADAAIARKALEGKP